MVSQACGTTVMWGSVADRGSRLGAGCALKVAHGLVGEPISHLPPSPRWEEQPGLCPGSPEQVLAREAQQRCLHLLFLCVSSSGKADTIIIIFLQSL